MVVYALIELRITNVAAMEPYILKVGDTIAAHGGRYLVRPRVEQLTGNAELVEGGADEYPLKVVLEFPSLAAGKGWYDSPEYQKILPHRLDNSVAKLVWAEGVE